MPGFHPGDTGSSPVLEMLFQHNKCIALDQLNWQSDGLINRRLGVQSPHREYGGLAQMVERSLCMREAVGSMPTFSRRKFNGRLVQWHDSRFGCERSRVRFSQRPCSSLQQISGGTSITPVAQWIRRLTSNQQIAGSSPAGGIFIKMLYEVTFQTII